MEDEFPQDENSLPPPCNDNNNPSANKNDPALRELITYYHRKTTNPTTIADYLKKDHNIHIGKRTVERRLADWNLRAARKTEEATEPGVLFQLIADQLEDDPEDRSGPQTHKVDIARKTGVHIRRDTVSGVMAILRPEGASARDPMGTRIVRAVLESLGPDDEWSADGHDKIAKYGFGIWAIRDKWSRYWIGIWVVPNNRKGMVVAYLWLSAVREIGGIPRQTTTDCGSENTVIYGLANALREAMDQPEGTPVDKRAHVFLRSVHNVVIERGWLDLRASFGYSFQHFFEKDNGYYDEEDDDHINLALWLWPDIVQRSLDEARDLLNNRRMRKNKTKTLPSGASPYQIYHLYDKYGGRPCLLPIDRELVGELMEAVRQREDPFDWGVPAEFAQKCETARQRLNLNVENITPKNGWTVFKAMLDEIQTM